jgi:hypothetical protein
MYMTDHGIRGIQKFDSSFRLLDMRFHYNSDIVKQTLEQISESGRLAYKKYLLLDFIFIIFLFVTMISISDIALVPPYVRNLLYFVCGLRALFDVFENILLLRMLGQYPVFSQITATICSWITTLKFIMLYIWLLFIVIQAMVHGTNLIRRFL